VDRELEETALTLGKSSWNVFFKITLPMARRTLLAGLALSSARALGDFGTTLMIAGNIPGRTQTLPLYIYGQVGSLNFGRANAAALLLVAVGIVSLYLVRRLEAGAHERVA
jgi:molybdate transport system permease protein